MSEQELEALHVAVMEILADVDPVGLIRKGAPPDEYFPEALELVDKLLDGGLLSSDWVCEVFSGFGGIPPDVVAEIQGRVLARYVILGLAWM